MFLHCSVFLRPDKEKNVNIVLLYGQAIGYKKHLSLFYVLTNEKHQHHTFRWAIGNHFLQSIWRKLAIILYRVFRENQNNRLTLPTMIERVKKKFRRSKERHAIVIKQIQKSNKSIV